MVFSVVGVSEDEDCPRGGWNQRYHFPITMLIIFDSGSGEVLTIDMKVPESPGYHRESNYGKQKIPLVNRALELWSPYLRST